MSAEDFTAIVLTTKLAALTTLLLLLLGTPIAWWLARSRSPLKTVVGPIVTLPLVLPPAVLGFYLLVLMGPQGPVGQLTQFLGLGLLPFTFRPVGLGTEVREHARRTFMSLFLGPEPVKHTPHLFRHDLMHDFGDTLAERDAAPFGESLSWVAPLIIAGHVLAALA